MLLDSLRTVPISVSNSRSDSIGTTRSLFNEVTLVAPPRDNNILKISTFVKIRDVLLYYATLRKITLVEDDGIEPPTPCL